MWSRMISAVLAAVLGAQLVTLISRRAAAAAPPQPAAPARVVVGGPDAGRQVSGQPAHGPTVPLAQLPPPLRLVSDGLTSLARCRDQEADPTGSSAADRGWAGRFGVELLQEAATAPGIAEPRVRLLLAESIRLANSALRSPDPADRVAVLERSLEAAREAFVRLQSGGHPVL